ncbi:hypothetical protein Acsp07_13220 [Actinomycetospora sp. NBRC 106378]|nr:hypothetical protein Acsp07_13220 [Actinomycetospora sp. NBRC 106378]
MNLPGLVVSTLVTGSRITTASVEVGANREGRRSADDGLVLAVQAASFENLAETAGNARAADAWRAQRGLTTDVARPPRVRVDRPRVEETTDRDEPAVGLRQRYGFPGGELDVFLGVLSEVDAYLIEPRAAVIAAQERLRARRGVVGAPDLPSGTETSAVGPGGSVARVRLLS